MQGTPRLCRVVLLNCDVCHDKKQMWRSPCKEMFCGAVGEDGCNTVLWLGLLHMGT